MPAFQGYCEIRTAGINTDDGRVHLDLKAADGASFDWTMFVGKQENNREILALAIAAISTNKNVYIQTRDTTPYAEIWWLSLMR